MTTGLPMFVRYFLYILAAALGSAALGGGFAAIVAFVSPEFVGDFFPKANAAAGGVSRYAAAVGMVWGLFIGTGVMAFCLLLATIHRIIDAFRGRGQSSTTST
jgi:hypothetical protein